MTVRQDLAPGADTLLIAEVVGTLNAAEHDPTAGADARPHSLDKRTALLHRLLDGTGRSAVGDADGGVRGVEDLAAPLGLGGADPVTLAARPEGRLVRPVRVAAVSHGAVHSCSLTTAVGSQASAYTASARTSSRSAARPRQSFVAVHSSTYRRCASGSGGGVHWAGSWSAFDRFVRAVTATSKASAPWSLAYASRCLASQALAPTGGERPSVCGAFETAGGVGKVSGVSAMVRGRGRF
ncbi:hypothetical protein GCM10010275_63100 [Streptomyces litmocidini]|nr:hypothetical protein GCM10010275_63100 [Streptomyces litmocidini]